MARAVTFTVDTKEFDTALRAYAALSRRTPAEVCNKKAYHIVRRAIWHTHKADYQTMADQLGQVLRTVKSGKRAGGLTMKRGKGAWTWTANRNGVMAPLLALIINARRGRKGKPGLRGAAMAAEFKKVFGARARSIAFIKSGWIVARDLFRRGSGGVGRGLPPTEGQGMGGPKQIGKPKGSATRAADNTWKAIATFTNSAWTKRDKGVSVIKYGTPALERAFAEETADTIAEVEKRLREQAQKAGIRTN